MAFVMVLMGLGILGIALRQSDDVPQIAAIAAALVLLLGGFLLMPPGWQLGLELMAIALILPLGWPWNTGWGGE